MWRFLGILVSAGATCPRVFCGNARTPYCLTWSQDKSDAVLHPCSNPSQMCVLPDLETREDLQCTEFNGYKFDFWNPYYGLIGDLDGFQWKSEGEFCDSGKDLCAPALYCGHNNTCYSKKEIGVDCIQGECRLGLTCNFGTCTAIGSIPIGQSVTSDSACVFFSISPEMHCISPAKSVLPPPVSCQSDSDCTGDDGSPGECVCALDESGSAYCALHPGDADFQRLLRSKSELNFAYFRVYYYKVLFYPILVSPIPCAGTIFPEVFLYDFYQSQTSAGGLMLMYLILLVSG